MGPMTDSWFAGPEVFLWQLTQTLGLVLISRGVVRVLMDPYPVVSSGSELNKMDIPRHLFL